MAARGLSEQHQTDAEYCAAIVRQADEDRWLAIHYAPESLRRRLMALAAFHVELRRIPDAVSEPPLGEIRLQWWRDALDELRAGKPPRAHPVVSEIAEAGLFRAEYAERLETAIGARARPLYERTFETLDALESWLDEAEGGFDRLSVLVAGGDAKAAEAAAAGGRAFALAREAQRLAPLLAEAARERARDLHRKGAGDLRKLDAAVAASTLHLSLTPLYLRCRGRFPVTIRLRLFFAMMFGVY